MPERCDESALREAEDENRPRQACDNGDDTDVARRIGPWVTSQIGGGIHDADDDHCGHQVQTDQRHGQSRSQMRVLPPAAMSA